MTIALFKPFILAAEEGERVWEKLVQKVVEREEVDAHTADGWYTDANEALTAADLAQAEQDSAKLQAEIDATQKKLDGRTKAAKALKSDAQAVPETDASANTSDTGGEVQS